jgi:hypothetical protein
MLLPALGSTPLIPLSRFHRQIGPETTRFTVDNYFLLWCGFQPTNWNPGGFNGEKRADFQWDEMRGLS